ncbi:MAG: hypothetical protein RBT01_02480 [Anaerolineaceae bacterium]|jgi:hypothetical protein|nr:hypothetical protein [Anaerolineaceae bacterium]
MTSIRKKRTYKPILSLDFDGVIHWYRHGWKGTAVIDDDPVPGAKEFIEKAQNYFSIVVYSSRSSTEAGIEAMQAWMEKHGFPKVKFAKDKPKAFITIDDRAIQFKGEWFDPEELLAFKPWNKE